MSGLASQLRFLRSVGLALVVLGGLATISFLAAQRTDTTLQLWIIGIGAAGIGLGVLLAYHVSIDWLNLRVLRRHCVGPGALPRDGAVVAFEGVARVEGEPLVSPLGGVPCAAYSYEISRLERSSRSSSPGSRHVACAKGWHMLPTRIVGSAGTLALRSFPGFEDELRAVVDGDAWLARARSLCERLEGAAEPAGQREREASLLEARHTLLDEVHQDYLVRGLGGEVGLHYEEETLPVGEPVCVVGTFDQQRQALTARRSRLGANLIVFRGRADEVIERLGAEASGYTKLAMVLIAVGALMVGHPFVMAAPVGPEAGAGRRPGPARTATLATCESAPRSSDAGWNEQTARSASCARRPSTCERWAAASSPSEAVELADPVAVALSVADSLREEGIQHALYGALLLAAYGDARETRDVDVAVAHPDVRGVASLLNDALGLQTVPAFERRPFVPRPRREVAGGPFASRSLVSPHGTINSSSSPEGPTAPG